MNQTLYQVRARARAFSPRAAFNWKRSRMTFGRYIIRLRVLKWRIDGGKQQRGASRRIPADITFDPISHFIQLRMHSNLHLPVCPLVGRPTKTRPCGDRGMNYRFCISYTRGGSPPVSLSRLLLIRCVVSVNNRQDKSSSTSSVDATGCTWYRSIADTDIV